MSQSRSEGMELVLMFPFPIRPIDCGKARRAYPWVPQPWGKSGQARPRSPLSPRALAPGRQPCQGHSSPTAGSPCSLMTRVMSTSFNFIKYFLTGSSKPSPIYISSYSSPAREQNRRLQVNLQYQFYRRPISRRQHSKGAAPLTYQSWASTAGPRELSLGISTPRKLIIV